MARKFQIKRGLKAGMPTLAQGELAMTIDSGSEGLFIGTGTENIELARKSDLDAIPTPDVSGQINTHNTDSSAHSDIRSSITTHTGNTSIHVTSDQKTAWDAKIDVTDIVNNLKTNASDKPLSAAMGVALEAYVLEQDDLMYEKLVPKTRKVNGKALSSDITLSASDISADPSGSAAKALTDAKTYTDTKIAAIPTPDVSGQIGEHNTNTEAHNDIRNLITGLTNRLNALADSDDTTLDQLSEIVAYIKNNKTLIDGITTSKVNVTDIINNLTTNVTNKPLSAAQGVVLKALIDAITVPTKVSELENDSGYLTGYTETDPTVPAWAKAKTKPTYTASEVGALPANTHIPSTVAEMSDSSDYAKKSEFADKVSKSGDTMTGKLTVPQVETGDGNSNFFQCRKFRGEGNADNYYHAIDFGYRNHDRVDFYEYGGIWSFYKNQTGKVNDSVLCGKITSNGWEGHAKLESGSTMVTSKLTENSNVIATTAFAHGLVDMAKPKQVSVTLSASGWNSSSKTQAVTVSGVLADETAQLITLTPALTSQTAYYEAGILCTRQAANSLTFTCKTVPTANLTVYVVIQEVTQG